LALKQQTIDQSLAHKHYSIDWSSQIISSRDWLWSPWVMMQR